MSLLILLWLAPASAGPTSALLKGIMQDSSSNPDPGQSTIDPVALTGEIKKKLAATNAELALVPSEAVAGSSAAGLAGEIGDICSSITSPAARVSLSGTAWPSVEFAGASAAAFELENQAENWSGFSEPLLHPFLMADELKESVTALSRRVDELESWIAAIDETATQVVSTAENSTVKLRQADEAVEQAKDPWQASPSE